MNSTTIAELADQLVLRAGFNGISQRDTLHAGDCAGVHRLHVADEEGHRTVIFKHATPPTTEAATLQWLAHHHMPVPHLLASDQLDGTLGLLLQDLGPPLRQPTLTDAGQAAAAAHRVPPVAGTAVLDTTRVADLSPPLRKPPSAAPTRRPLGRRWRRRRAPPGPQEPRAAPVSRRRARSLGRLPRRPPARQPPRRPPRLATPRLAPNLHRSRPPRPRLLAAHPPTA